MIGKRRSQEGGASGALSPLPKRQTRRSSEGELLSDALQPQPSRRVSPRSATRKEEVTAAIAAESMCSPTTSDAQNPKPAWPVMQEGPSSIGHQDDGNPAAPGQQENTPPSAPGACLPLSRPFTPCTGGPFSPTTDISIGGSYGTHEEMQESECTGAPPPAAEAPHETDGCYGDESNDEDNSVNITDEDNPSSQRHAQPAGPSSEGTAASEPGTRSASKGMTIECLEDARRALAIAIVKMDGNERNRGAEADATVVLHHMKQRLRPGDHDDLDQLQMCVFLERLQGHPNKTIKAKACQLYSKDDGYVLTSKPTHNTKPLGELRQDEAVSQPLSDTALRKDADGHRTLSGAANGRAGNAAGDAASPPVRSPGAPEDLACNEGNLSLVRDQACALAKRPSEPQRSGVGALHGQATSMAHADLASIPSGLPEDDGHAGSGRASVSVALGGSRQSSGVPETEPCAGNSTGVLSPRDVDTFAGAGPAGEELGPTSRGDSRQRRSGQESSQENSTGAAPLSTFDANPATTTEHVLAEDNRLTTPPTPPETWLASSRLVNANLRHDAGQDATLDLGQLVPANMQGTASELPQRPLSSSSNANPSSQGATSSGSRARNSGRPTVNSKPDWRQDQGTNPGNPLEDASQQAPSQGLLMARGSQSSLSFGQETALPLDRAQEGDLWRTFTPQTAVYGGINSDGAGPCRNANWKELLGTGPRQSVPDARQGGPQAMARAGASQSSLSLGLKKPQLQVKELRRMYVDRAALSASRAANLQQPRLSGETSCGEDQGDAAQLPPAGASQGVQSQGVARGVGLEPSSSLARGKSSQVKKTWEKQLSHMYSAPTVGNGSTAPNPKGARTTKGAKMRGGLANGAGHALGNASGGLQAPQSMARAIGSQPPMSVALGTISKADVVREDLRRMHAAFNGAVSMGMAASTPGPWGPVPLWGQGSGTFNQSVHLQERAPSAAPQASAALVSSVLANSPPLQGLTPAALEQLVAEHRMAQLQKQARHAERSRAYAEQLERASQLLGVPQSASAPLATSQALGLGTAGLSNAELQRLLAGGYPESQGMIGMEDVAQFQHLLGGHSKGVLEPLQGGQDAHTPAAQALKPSKQRGRQGSARADSGAQQAQGGPQAQAKGHAQREKGAAEMVYKDAMMGLDGRYSLLPVLPSSVLAPAPETQNPTAMALGQQHLTMDGGGQQGVGVENMLNLMRSAPQGMSREGAQNWLRQALFRDGTGQSPLGPDNMGLGPGHLAAKGPLDGVQQMNKTLSQAASGPGHQAQQALQAQAAPWAYGQGWPASGLGSGRLPSQSPADADDQGPAMEMLRQWSEQN